MYDELFGHVTDTNAERRSSPPTPFTAETVERDARRKITQAASAALLRSLREDIRNEKTTADASTRNLQ